MHVRKRDERVRTGRGPRYLRRVGVSVGALVEVPLRLVEARFVEPDLLLGQEVYGAGHGARGGERKSKREEKERESRKERHGEG